MTAALFAVAAGCGAALRHGVNQLGHGWRGTLALNVLGALLLGWMVSARPADELVTVLGTGLLGSFTTFSTFALEVVETNRAVRLGVVAASLVFGVGAAFVGASLG